MIKKTKTYLKSCAVVTTLILTCGLIPTNAFANSLVQDNCLLEEKINDECAVTSDIENISNFSADSMVKASTPNDIANEIAVDNEKILQAANASTANVNYSILGTPTVNNQITIAVNVSSVSNLYGASVDFKYDPSLLTINSISAGTLFQGKIESLAVNKVENGQAHIAMSLKGNDTPLSGTGSIALINATVSKAGLVNLTTTNKYENLSSNFTSCVKLSNNLGRPILYSFTNKTLGLYSDPVVVNSLTSNKVSPQAAKTPITFTAKASGGYSLLYQFWVKDSSGWKMVRDYNSSNSFTWTPSSNGNYTISVYCKDINSSKTADSIKTCNYVIKDSAPVVVNSLTPNKVSPQAAKTPVTFTAKASGGSSLLYQFWVKDSSGWKMVRDYNSSNSFTWTPSSKGVYTISVYAKDSKSSKLADSIKTLNYTIN